MLPITAAAPSVVLAFRQIALSEPAVAAGNELTVIVAFPVTEFEHTGTV